MLLHIKHNKKEILSFINKMHPKLCEYFGVEVKCPSINLVKSPRMYAKYLIGDKRRRITHRDIVDCYETTSAFYDHNNNIIFVPAFTRSGQETFEIPKYSSVPAQSIIHEMIHSFQYQTGGYSFSDFFEEACAELCTYALAANIEPGNAIDYFLWVGWLYAILQSSCDNSEGILEWVRKFNIASHRDEMVKDAIRAYIKQHELHHNWKGIHTILENQDMKKASNLPKLKNVDEIEIQNELYKLFEKYRIV